MPSECKNRSAAQVDVDQGASQANDDARPDINLVAGSESFFGLGHIANMNYEDLLKAVSWLQVDDDDDDIADASTIKHLRVTSDDRLKK